MSDQPAVDTDESAPQRMAWDVGSLRVVSKVDDSRGLPAYDEVYAQALRALGLYVTPVDTTIAPTWTDTGGTS